MDVRIRIPIISTIDAKMVMRELIRRAANTSVIFLSDVLRRVYELTGWNKQNVRR